MSIQLSGLLQEMRDVLPAIRNALFIAEELEKGGLMVDFTAFVSGAAEKIEAIDDLNQFINSLSGLTTPEDAAALNKVKIGKQEKRLAVYKDLFDEFHKQADKIRIVARAALSLAGRSMAEGPPLVNSGSQIQ